MNNKDINVELKDEIINIHIPYADRGLPGKSAYQLAVEHGYVGTETEWIASLKGETGETPDIEIGNVVTGSTSSVTRRGTDENPIFDFVLEKGETGPQGETGATGPQGQTGLTPSIQIGTVSSGNAPAVTRTGSDEEPIFNFVLEKGPKPVKGEDYYTEEDKEEIVDDVTGDALSVFNQNAAQKTEAFNSNATSKTSDFNTNAASKTNEFNTNATNKTTDFNTNASAKTTAFDDNATAKTTAFNDNATQKTNEFNTNAQNKTDEFNDNVEDLELRLERSEMVYNALPKVTGTGTSITLNDTANAPMKMIPMASELEQASTSGINLMPMNRPSFSTNNVTFTNNDNNSFTLNGKKTSSIGEKLTQNFNYSLVNGKTYTLAIELLGGTVSDLPTISNIAISTSGNNNYKYFSILDLATIGQKKVFSWTQNEDIDIIAYYFWVGGNAVETIYNNYKIKVWLVEGSYTSSTIPYEPYTGGNPAPSPDYPQEIHTISGDNEIVVGNKNWFDISLLSQESGYNTYNSTTGLWTTSAEQYFNRSIFYNAVGTDSNRDITKLIKLPAGNYTVKIYDYINNTGAMKGVSYSLFNSNGVKQSEYNNNDFVNITLQDLSYLDIRRHSMSGTFSFSKIMIVKGTYTKSNFPEYEPHQEQTLPLNLGDLEVCKIGDYEDKFVYNETDTTLELNKWYLKKNIGKVVLDGSENWVYGSSYKQYSLVYPNLNGIKNSTNVYSEYFKIEPFRIRIGNTPSLIWIFDANDYFNADLNTFKSFLSNNNASVYYQTTVSTYILLNDTLQTQLNNIRDKVLAYQNQTNISQVNNDLPFTIKASAIRDMSNIFELIENASSTPSTLSTLSSPLSTPNLVSPVSIAEPEISTDDVINNDSEI